MTRVTYKMNKFIEIGQRIKRYRDIRLNPLFIEKEKLSTRQFILEEEVSSILEEDKLFSETTIKDLLELRDTLVMESNFSNDDLEEFSFETLFNGSSDDFVLLRIYKEIEYLVTKEEVKDIQTDRFSELIKEYLEEELTSSELEEIERENQECIDRCLQEQCDEESEEEVAKILLKREFEDELLSCYTIFLNSYLITLDKNSKEYKKVRKFLENMFFINKNLERINEFLYNNYVKNIPPNLNYFAKKYEYPKDQIIELKTEIFLDCYDYGVESLFKDQKYRSDSTLTKLKYIYLNAIQSMLEKKDLDSLLTIVDDNYEISQGMNSKVNCDEIKKDLENNIYLNEENNIRGKAYIKRWE